jgi:hypothetical protein
METIKTAFITILNQTKEIFKNFINKTRLPSLVDLIFKPTLAEALKDAPVASENWVRLGLEKTWKYFALLIVVLLVYFFKNSLQFVIEIVAQVGIVAVFGVAGYWIYKQIK